jgi:hypothetical protein
MPLSFDRIRGHAFRTGTTKAHQRDEQFERLKPKILDCASRKYFAGQFEGGEPRILVRTADLTPR